MGNVLDKTKDAGEPSNQDAFVFWYNLKDIYGHPETLLDNFQPFMVDQQDQLLDDEESGARQGGRPPSHSISEDTAYVTLGSVKEDARYPSPASSSKISFVKESPQADEINRNLLQTINCKLQLIPPELNHFTLNLDNHYLSERMALSICAAIIANNENYHNRHLTLTHKDTPMNTIRKKKIQAEYQEMINQYYFNLTKLSLKRTLISMRGLEAVAQSLRNNYSLMELDLGGNELMSTGLAVLTSGLRFNKSITRLNLSDVRAYDEGAFMIAAFLMTTKSLRILDLSTNHITDRGFEALKQAVMRNTSITSVYLSDNNIDPTKLYSLSLLLKRNTCVQYVMDSIFDRLTFNRKFKNKLHNFKKGVMQVRSNSTLNFNVDQDDKTPLYRLMGKQNQPLPTPEQLPSNRFSVGKSETIGKRSSMEDRMVAYGRFRDEDNSELYCIFDGHGGKAASDYAADNIYRIFSDYLNQTKYNVDESFKLAYQAIHTHIAPWPFIGTTAASVYIKDNLMISANAGDSRIVLGYLDDNNQIKCDRLTFDHRPVEDSERLRIQSAGGTVLNGRVNGMLAVSRALGDSFLTPYVISDPYIRHTKITDKCKFLIIACDGVWDIISDEEAVQVISTISDPSKSSETLRDLAFAQGSTDNISVMVVKLNDY